MCIDHRGKISRKAFCKNCNTFSPTNSWLEPYPLLRKATCMIAQREQKNGMAGSSCRGSGSCTCKGRAHLCIVLVPGNPMPISRHPHSTDVHKVYINRCTHSHIHIKQVILSKTLCKLLKVINRNNSLA